MKKKISFVPDVNSNNLLDKEKDKSSYSNFDLTIVALPFLVMIQKMKNFLKLVIFIVCIKISLKNN